MVGRAMLALYLLSPAHNAQGRTGEGKARVLRGGLLWIPSWQPVEAGMRLGKARQLSCSLEVPLDPSHAALGGDPSPQRRHIQLVLSSSESHTLPHQASGAAFFLQGGGPSLPCGRGPGPAGVHDEPLFHRQHADPVAGLPSAPGPAAHLVHGDRHPPGGSFRISTFCFQPTEPAPGPGPTPLSGVFSLYTKAPRVQVRLEGTVLLACGFSVDHAPEAVDMSWMLQQKGGQRRELLKYSGKQGRVTHLHKQAEAFPGEIPRGNASIRLSNVAVEDQGNYICSVSAAGLHLELASEVAVVEPPKVTLSPQTPALTLEEGEEQKLVCKVSRYFPLEAHIQWLREPLEGRMLPEVVKNVLFSNHRQSGDGTYSLSSYFLLKASRSDDGFRYTCRVEHQGLHFPIRKSITVRVTERFGHSSWLFLFIFAVLMLLLAVLLKYLNQVRQMNKRKPY
ncbi:tapasin-like [Sminthopsis crassicaudata]|uniref:tapasin-like n=1 Tax=Sminthopsis crassicaudata TaxID=9301 RepID=UPI003D682996